MSGRYDLVIFDCDGVLIDSEPLGSRALAEAITTAGHPMTREQALAIFTGMSAGDVRARLAGMGLDAGLVFAEADRILFDLFPQHLRPMAGIEEVLAGLEARLCVASNSSMERLARSLGILPIHARFGANVFSADHVTRPKPAPDLALHCLRQMDVPAERAIFVDDNTHGILCARAAGVLAVGFIDPNDPRPNRLQTLRDAGADHVVTGSVGLHALLSRLLAPEASLAAI